MSDAKASIELDLIADQAQSKMESVLAQIRQIREEAANVHLNLSGGIGGGGSGIGGASATARSTARYMPGSPSRVQQQYTDARQAVSGPVNAPGTLRTSGYAYQGSLQDFATDRQAILDMEDAYRFNDKFNLARTRAAQREAGTYADYYSEMAANQARAGSGYRGYRKGLAEFETDADVLGYPGLNKASSSAMRSAVANALGPLNPDDYDDPSVQAGIVGLQHHRALSALWGRNIGGYGYSAGRGMLLALGEAGTSYLSAETQALLAGRPDRMATNRISGQLFGGVAGALVGGLMGPFGGLIGAGIGGQFGGALSEVFTAPSVLRDNLMLSLAPAVGLLGPLGGNPVAVGMSDTLRPFVPLNQMAGNLAFPASTAQYQQWRVLDWANRLSPHVTDTFWGGNKQISASVQETIETYRGAVSGLLAGGTNPLSPGMSVNQVAYPYLGYAPGFYQDARDRITGRKPMDANVPLMADIGGMAIASLPSRYRESEDIAQTLTRRMTERYGKAAPEMMKSIEPILGSLPDTGGNYLDILLKYGPEATQRYSDVQVETGETPPTSLDKLLLTSFGVRTVERSMSLKRLQARGVGASLVTSYKDEMAYMGNIGGYKDSLAYARARAGLRDAEAMAFEEGDVTAYQIPASRLRTLRGIADAEPFSSVSRYSVDLQSLNLNSGEIGRLRRYMQARRAAGDLSESEELALTQRIGSLQVEMAQGIGELGESWPNRLPALAAGRPSFFASMNSNSLAAAELNVLHSPIRSWGAMGGHQAAEQVAWARQYFQGDTSARSQTAAINSGDPHIVALLERQVNLLERLVQRGSGGSDGARGAFPRWSDQRNSMYGLLDRMNIPSQRAVRGGTN